MRFKGRLFLAMNTKTFSAKLPVKCGPNLQWSMRSICSEILPPHSDPPLRRALPRPRVRSVIGQPPNPTLNFFSITSARMKLISRNENNALVLTCDPHVLISRQKRVVGCGPRSDTSLNRLKSHGFEYLRNVRCMVFRSGRSRNLIGVKRAMLPNEL